MKAVSNRGVSSLAVAALAVAFAAVSTGATAAHAQPAGPRTTGARSAGAASGASTYVPVPPLRIMDTRHTLGAEPPIAGGTARLKVDGVAQIPSSGVAAVVLTLVVIAPGSSGYVTAFPDGAARPTTSNLNFLAGQTLADQVYAPVGADGSIDFYNGTHSTLRLIADVSGYFATQAAVAGAFVPTTPTRLLDTRSSLGGTAPAGRSTLHLKVLGRGPVPASGVSAVAFTLTALRPAASGYLTAYADGTSRPGTANLAFATGHTIGNMVIAQVGADGDIAVYNGSAGTTQLVVDVAGYFLAGRGTAPGAYVPITPTRTLTEDSLGPRAQDAAIAGRSPLPPSPTAAAVLNVTVTGATATGWALVWFAPTRPATSTLNFDRGQAATGMATVPANPLIYNGSDGTARFTVDYFGYYVAPPGMSAVAGTATDAGDGRGVAGVPVLAYVYEPASGEFPAVWDFYSDTVTDSAGHYLLAGLYAPYQYRVCFDTRSTAGHQPSTGYRAQCWAHVTWPTPGGGVNSDFGATTLNLTPSVTTTGIDARLATVKVGGIQGTVTGAGTALAGVVVSVQSTDTAFKLKVTTVAGGAFSFTTLPADTYRVCFTPGTVSKGAPYGFLPSCRDETVTAGAVATVGEQLIAAGAIAGRLVTASGAAIVDGGVSVYDGSGTFVTGSALDASGDFTVSPLPPASYTVCLDGGDPTLNPPYGFVAQCYRGRVWYSRFLRLPTGTTPVAVTAGAATAMGTTTLAVAGAISGTVVGPDGKALDNVGVYVFDRTTGALDGVGQTGTDGYIVTGLAPSTGYTVCFNGQNSGDNPSADHGSKCWNNVAWDGQNTDVPAGAGAVSVVGNSTHTGIGATLPR